VIMGDLHRLPSRRRAGRLLTYVAAGLGVAVLAAFAWELYSGAPRSQSWPGDCRSDAPAPREPAADGSGRPEGGGDQQIVGAN